MIKRTVAQRLAGIIRALHEEAKEHSRYGRDLEAGALEHFAKMVGDVQEQARAEEEAP